VKKDDKPCPLCGEQDFTFMRERGLERFLKGSEVWCSYKEEGCEWKGKLEKLEEHLNQDPCTSPGIQLSKCEFVAVECMYKCGEWFQRRHIATHQKEQCKKRLYSCEFCQYYTFTFEYVTEIHYPQCGKYPVACPNDCDVYKMERQDLEGHLRDKCPLTLVDCPFHYAGCETQLPRKDMPDHMKETVTHLTLLATATQKLMKENMDLRHMVQAIDADMRALKEDLHQEINTSGRLLEFRVKYTEEEVYTPAFYTHLHGYRICFCVYPKGRGDGEGTHVSIFTYMMRGPFDDYLKWPFRGEITIQLVNQAGDHDHVEKIIYYTDEILDMYTSRVTGRERATSGWGFHQVLAHSHLGYDAARKTQYLKNNHIVVRVVKVVLK
jgi:TNF receptor-associated factor 4